MSGIFFGKGGEAQSVRKAFDGAWDAADKAETLQRLDGLTRARPVASIVPAPSTVLEERDRALAELALVSRALGMLETGLDLPVSTAPPCERIAACLDRISEEMRAAREALQQAKRNTMS